MPNNKAKFISWTAAFLFCTTLTRFGHAMGQDEFQLLFPENNVSSKPILEFRVRTDSLTGHAFMAVARELDNGLTYYYTVGGFYPKNDGTLAAIKYQLSGPGEVTFKAQDWQHDYKFRVSITADQERTVNFMLQNWDSHRFSLLTQNCVSLMNDVAASVGLSTSNDPQFLQTPRRAIEFLIGHNDSDRPLKYAGEHSAKQSAQRATINANQYQRERDNYERERALAIDRNLRQAVQEETSRAAGALKPPRAPLPPAPAAEQVQALPPAVLPAPVPSTPKQSPAPVVVQPPG